MNEDAAFSARIRAAFPEGLTGIIAIGGTRTSYILENNRQQTEPGIIPIFDYAEDLLEMLFQSYRYVFKAGWSEYHHANSELSKF